MIFQASSNPNHCMILWSISIPIFEIQDWKHSWTRKSSKEQITLNRQSKYSDLCYLMKNKIKEFFYSFSLLHFAPPLKHFWGLGNSPLRNSVSLKSLTSHDSICHSPVLSVQFFLMFFHNYEGHHCYKTMSAPFFLQKNAWLPQMVIERLYVPGHLVNLPGDSPVSLNGYPMTHSPVTCPLSSYRKPTLYY